MKYSVQSLKKLSYTNNEIDEMIDFGSKVNDEIVKVEPCHVYGYFDFINDDEIVFDLTIDINIYMLCAISLEEVKVPLNFDVCLHFAHKIIDDDTYLIDGLTVNLDDVIWGNILVEKPMRVVKKGVTYNPETNI